VTDTFKHNPTVPLAVGSRLLVLLLLRGLLRGGDSETVIFDLKNRRAREDSASNRKAG
jgi:hypothetical protein